MSRIYDKLFSSPARAVGSTAGLVLIGYFIAVCLPFRTNIAYGSHEHLNLEDSLVLKGQEVYYQEGCQYCHTQNLRPFNWEVSRYANAEKYGYFPMPVAMEYAFESPSMRGSRRLGPDLSRLAGRLDADALRGYFKGGKEDSLKNRFHSYKYLFEDTDLQPLFLSWRIRMMLESRVPLSDPLQKGVFDRLEGQSRGDALVAYLASL